MFIYRCSDACDLLRKCESLALTSSSGKWFFRGQGDSAWGLCPSAARETHDAAQLGKAEHSLLLFMRRLVRERTAVADSLVADDDVLLAMAQHYGVRTRLLDWSLDPDVGLYFAASGALRNAPPSGSLSVFAMASIYLNVGKAGEKASLVFPPRAANANLTAQRGVLTKHDWSAPNLWDDARASEIDDPIENVTARIDSRLVRLDLNTAHVDDALALLIGRGVDASVLFPSEHGIARFAEDMMLLDSAIAAKVVDRTTYFVAK